MLKLFSERLKEARLTAGYTQIQVRDHTGVNNKTLSGYENNISEPDFETLKVLCDFYGVTTDWVLGHTNNPHSKLTEAERDMVEKVDLDDDSFIKGDFNFAGRELTVEEKKELQAMARLFLNRKTGN
ncbi:helix-turn-helix domain-containing protein [Paenibacillus pabuli]|uniref:helix-turn-helix domain-containing protein n=1 Tax=Paenibacillus pabuli TaxID=1472 RepID=UPI001FFEC7B3|nr:helix-turn-helix transcriptional regulator [Paenibacillus pabuli]UPK45916.1 helix-turn-helix transcriptional regulator [Paenibacillus pabuli]